jgi:hypothetical protein
MAENAPAMKKMDDRPPPSIRISWTSYAFKPLRKTVTPQEAILTVFGARR